MAGYAQQYRDEVEAHRKSKQRLTISTDVITSFREFLEAKGLQGEFVEFMLVRCVGENRAREIIGDSSSPSPAKEKP